MVPAYNEELHIGGVLELMPDYVDAVYVVDDGSTDRTRQIVQHYAATESRIHPVTHASNRGVGAAIVTGYRCCLADGMDVAAVMAGDNQMDPALLSALLDPLVDGRADYAKGSRMLVPGHRRGMSWWRVFGNWLLRWLTAAATGNVAITDPQNGFTAISRRALDQLNLSAVYPGYGYCNHLISRLTALRLAIVEIAMAQVINQGQKSKIRYVPYSLRMLSLLAHCLVFRLRVTLSRSPGLSSCRYEART